MKPSAIRTWEEMSVQEIYLKCIKENIRMLLRINEHRIGDTMVCLEADNCSEPSW